MTNGDTNRTAWFTAEEKCFPRDSKWLHFKAMIWITNTDLWFRLRSGACWEECYINITQTNLMTLSVVAQGPSRWLTESPNEKCEIHELENTNRSLISDETARRYPT
ncbi:hypothetical protein E2C01_075383 [Portunus trituberculatus]|uniref:Uncharacterized protein n=1 Tax=Portunus trituberculatus TaxID=210409 RepID=A0A5B7I8E5_PORTR|nr:hypothetical protein [Portunus trituberculatus]